MASSREYVTAWRIVKSAYAKNAFDGGGARLTGGRWSSPGRAATYTAGSVALATLEMLVHLQNAALLETYVLIPCRFQRRYITTVDPSRLPRNWRQSPAPAALRRIGDEWLASRASVILDVPSAVVVEERNYLLNPAHDDFDFVTIGAPRPFRFDSRLTGNRG